MDMRFDRRLYVRPGDGTGQTMAQRTVTSEIRIGAHREAERQTTPVVMQQQQQNVTVQGTNTAGIFMANIPADGGDAAAPDTQPQLPTQTEVVDISKAEKRALRRSEREEALQAAEAQAEEARRLEATRQEEERRQAEEARRQEEERRQAEEQAEAERLRLEEERRQAAERAEAERRRQEAERVEAARREAARAREEAQREIEQTRQQRRRMLLQMPEVTELLSAAVQEQDPQLRMDRLRIFLRVAAEKLLASDPQLLDEYSGTVDYTDMIASYQILIAEQASDGEVEGLISQMDRQAAQLRLAQHESTVDNCIARGLAEIFDEEIRAMPELERAIQNSSIDSDTFCTGVRNQTGEFEHNLKAKLKVEEGDQLIGKHGVFSYVSKPERIADLQQRMTAYKTAHPEMTEKDAEKAVLLKLREELKDRAIDKSQENGLVSGVTRDEWKQSGGASYNMTVPIGEAIRYVQRSRGFLYYEDKKDGTAELHQTLPSYFSINGKEIRFRHAHNLVMKLIADAFVDEQGRLRDDSQEFFSMFEDYYLLRDRMENGQVIRVNDEVLPDMLKQYVSETFETRINRLFGADAAPVILEEVTDYFLATAIKEGGTFACFALFNGEARSTLSGFAGNIARMNRPLDEILAEERTRLTDAGASEEEIEKQLDTIRDFKVQSTDAIAELLNIRSMDPDSMQVPLINACSANGDGLVSYMRVLGIASSENNMDDPVDAEGINMGKLEYFTERHVMSHPLEHLEYIRAHHEAAITEQTLNKIEASVKTSLALGEQISRDVYRFLLDNSKAAMKYEYHVAGNVGYVPETDETMTVEEFAAETTTFVVAPISTHAAVGLYKNRAKGMEAYYNHDNPLPTAEGEMKAAAKQRIQGRGGEER